MKYLFACMICLITGSVQAQHIGINTTSPQATLDVKGTQRVGGSSNYMQYDSATGKIEWVGASLFTPVSQQIIRHSASSEGLYAGGGKLDYRNSIGDPVFYSDWTNGNGYFSGNLGIGKSNPTAKLQIYDGPSGITPFFSARLVVETNSHSYINLLSPDPFETGILFGSGTNAASGVISYNSTDAPKGLLFSTNGNQQRMVIDNKGTVAIGTTTPDASALMEISSTSKGFLPPRMTMAQRNAITTATAGLILYCTDCIPAGPYSYNGNAWNSMTSSAANTAYTIGQLAQGGIVFWVDDSGQHGLAAGTDDQNGGAFLPWWNNLMFTNTNATRDGIYGGAYNTYHINDNQGNGNYAAMAATMYTGGGYGDWYLPSKGEMNLMFQNIYPVGGFVHNSFYWSSTEQMVAAGSVADYAWCQMADTGGGFAEYKQKANNCRVRAIRRF